MYKLRYYSVSLRILHVHICQWCYIHKICFCHPDINSENKVESEYLRFQKVNFQWPKMLFTFVQKPKTYEKKKKPLHLQKYLCTCIQDLNVTSFLSFSTSAALFASVLCQGSKGGDIAATQQSIWHFTGYLPVFLFFSLTASISLWYRVHINHHWQAKSITSIVLLG